MMRNLIRILVMAVIAAMAIIGGVNIYNGVCYHGALLSCRVNGAVLTVLNEGCESRGSLKTPIGDELKGIICLTHNEDMIAGISHQEDTGLFMFIVETTSFKIRQYDTTAEFLSAIRLFQKGYLKFHSPLYVVSSRFDD